MRRKDRGFPPPAVAPRDVVAFATGMLEPLAARYEHLAERCREAGRADTAELFADLAAAARRRIAEIRDRGRRHRVAEAEPEPAPSGLIDEDVLQSLELWERRPELASPYRVLAVAVRLQEALFHLCAGLGATATSREAEEMAEEIAREALADAARLRARRRAAYHAARPQGAARPTLPTVETATELAAVARQIDARLAELLRAACAERPELTRLVEQQPALAGLPKDAATAEAPAEQPGIAWLSEPLPPGAEAGDAVARLRLFAEQAFEFYDRVFTSARREEVMLEAQQRGRLLLALLHILEQLDHARGRDQPPSQ